MTTRADSPGVWFPPPLWYVLAILIGVLLDRLLPLPIAAGVMTTAAGVIFVVAGVTLAFVSIGRFRGSKTSMVPIRSADALVLHGPYRYMETLVTHSDLDWTVLRPARLGDGVLTRRYTASPMSPADAASSAGMSRADVAHMMLETVERGAHVKEIVWLRGARA